MPKLASTASIDLNAGEILDLISHFQRAAAAAVTELQQQVGARDLLKAWKQGRIARTGRLSRSKFKYAFHGAGCRFETPSRIIEIEFGPRGRFDGFDDWRLEQYAAAAFEWQSISPRRIGRGLKTLESVGTIVKPGWEPTPHLYYVNEDIIDER